MSVKDRDGLELNDGDSAILVQDVTHDGHTIQRGTTLHNLKCFTETQVEFNGVLSGNDFKDVIIPGKFLQKQS